MIFADQKYSGISLGDAVEFDALCESFGQPKGSDAKDLGGSAPPNPAAGGACTDNFLFSWISSPEAVPQRASGSGFDEGRYWRARGAVLKAHVPSIEVVGRFRSFASLRGRLIELAGERLPRRTASHVIAAAAGERDELASTMHMAVGTTHLLAVSGFHVGAVCAAVLFVLRRLPLRHMIASIVVWAYVMLAGAPASAMRAAIMLQFVLVGRMIGRPSSPFNAAAAAGALMLAVEPAIFWDVGWRLSMASILGATSAASMRAGAGVKVAAAAIVIWLATTAISAPIFGPQPVVGLVVNIVAIPLFAVLYPIAFLFSIPAMLGWPAGDVAAAVPETLFRMWETFAANVRAIVPMTAGASRALDIAAAAACCFAFALSSGCGWRRAAILSLICALFLYSLPFIV